MDKLGLIQRFSCGKIEEKYENSRVFSMFMQLIFTLVGAYFLWDMLPEPTFFSKLDNMGVLIFCLWRIHRQRDIMCYVTEKGIIVRKQFMSLREFIDEQIHEEKSLVFIPYEDIFSISDDWREIQLGMPAEGGIAVLSIHLQFLSAKHKQIIIQRIKKEQEK
jgi:hypothetical protein